MRQLRATLEACPAAALTRRGILSALPMAIAGGAVVAVATNPVPLPSDPHPDADLIRLGEAFEAAWRYENEEYALLKGVEQTFENEAVVCASAHAAADATSALVDQIMECRAVTIEGLRVKARAVCWCHAGDPIDEQSFGSDGTDVRVAATIVRDLLGA